MSWPPPFQFASMFGNKEEKVLKNAISPSFTSQSTKPRKQVTHHCAFVHIDEVLPSTREGGICRKSKSDDWKKQEEEDEDKIQRDNHMAEKNTNLTRSVTRMPRTTSSVSSCFSAATAATTTTSVSCRAKVHHEESSNENLSTCDDLNRIGKTPIRSNISNNEKRYPSHHHGIQGAGTVAVGTTSRIHARRDLECDELSHDENWGSPKEENHCDKSDATALSPPRIQSVVKNYIKDGHQQSQFDSMVDALNAAGGGDKDQGENEESYEKMHITIDKNNGIISFTSASFQCDVNNRDDDSNGRDRDGQPVSAVDDTHNYDDSSPPLKDAKGPTMFPLMPTKHQTHKEYKQKLYHQTRKACLEAAMEAYKSASKDIPDMILAQFNDHRNYLSGNKTYSTSFKTEKRFGHARNVTDTGKIIPREDFNCKVIKLQKVDEIHVAPCQCALRLLGMENQPQKGGPSQHSAAQLKSSNVREKRVKPLHNIEEDGNDVSVGEIRHSRTASVINDDRLVMKLIGTYKNTANSMVRTSSARVTSSFISETNMRDQPCTRKGIISTANDASHSRPESNPLNLSEFHEITLIRNGSVTPLGDEKLQCEDLDGEFVEWDAVTIRCSNHDELDLLVKELRDSSKAKVVPFSSNPKYRSRWNRARRRGMESNTSRTKITESHVKEKMEGLITVSTEKISSRDNVSPIWDKQIDQDSTFATSTSSRGDPDSDKLVSNNVAEIKGSSERKTFDSNFNKMQFCELCDLTFTLLTRRHHCRRCERSCCGHCSRILIVKGCDEKRYCNWCASDILQKQSYALRGRLFHKDQDDFLPGKVHDACFRLGVGFTGRLPHWKTFLYPKLEDRPAVGRITIEVIEAIALPSVDMVNGKVDPYVRATITGYDRDMKWTLRQWLQSHRYSLCSRFCSATLSPLWRGTGKLGGELLTLPVISTAGAVLRLEVLHYNVLTTRDKDPVLGVVEIPLSDLPNANLRHPGGVEVETDRGKKRNIKFDGYCDRWYRLLQSEEFDTKYIMLSKPILSPIDANTSKKQGNRKVGMQSLEEVGKRMLGLTIAPVEWLASAIKLDLPARRPEAVCRQHKARSMIHVRLKLNASIVGDVLSHAWFPPVRPFPLPPPYDPEVLLSRILQVGKQTEPYRNIIQHIELCIKWKYPAKVCILSYAIFGFHVAIFPYLLPVFHVYLFIFLWTRLRQMRVIHEDDEMLHSLQCHEAFDGLGSCQKGGNKKFVREKIVESHNSSSNYENTVPLPVPKSSLRESHKNSDQVGNTVTIHNSPSLVGLRYQRKEEWKNRSTLAKTKLSQSSSNTSLADSRDRLHESRNIADNNFEEEVTKLNIAIHWIAKRLGDNKGLEVLQFKLGMLGRDLRNVNSVWNGKNPFLTRATMAYLVISFVLHFLMNQRLLWLLGTSTWYFAQAPFCVLTARFIFGFSRGIAKVMRRQQLLDGELLSRVVA